MKYTFISKNTQETLEFGKNLASYLGNGDVLLLRGDLGAGKTTITKGVAQGLAITERVNSPTFNILKLYLKGSKNLFHIDAYRLEQDKNDIGLDEYIGGEGITIIEWPDYIATLLPKKTIDITINHIDLESREITIEVYKEKTELVNYLRGLF